MKMQMLKVLDLVIPIKLGDCILLAIVLIAIGAAMVCFIILHAVEKEAVNEGEAGNGTDTGNQHWV